MNIATCTLVVLALVSCTMAQAPAPGPSASTPPPMVFDINVNINVEGFHATLNGTNLLGNPLGLVEVRGLVLWGWCVGGVGEGVGYGVCVHGCC